MSLSNAHRVGDVYVNCIIIGVDVAPHLLLWCCLGYVIISVEGDSEPIYSLQKLLIG